MLLSLGLCGVVHAQTQVTCTSSCSSSQNCTFDGIENVALGAATLQVDANCHLIVSNLGGSGQDGVSQINLPPNIEEVVTEFEESAFGPASNPGDRQVVMCHANVPGGVFTTVTVENIGQTDIVGRGGQPHETIQVSSDFSSVGATVYTIIVMDGATVTGVFENLTSAVFQTSECTEVEFN